MSYDLKTRGIKDFRRYVDRLTKAVRDPLEGSVGTNTTFRARFYPISSDPTPIVYTSGSVDPADYSLDRESGVLEFDSAPSAQPTMTYKWSNMTDDTVVNLLASGVEEMESRWPRRFKMVDSDGTTVIYPEDATEINVVDSGGSDPTCGNDTFSTSLAEIRFLMACANYAWLSETMGRSAVGDFMYREDRGITVDKRRVPLNIGIALENADKAVKATMRGAQAKYYTDGSHLGEAQLSPHTKDYFANFEWQTDSRDEDYRTNYAGTGG